MEGRFPETCLEALRKNTENLSQDSLSPGWDLNSGPPAYKAGVPTTLTSLPVG
jgi:hypothetical protein